MSEELSKAEFIYQQAKLRLDASSESIETLDKKALTLTAIIIPLLNILLGYVMVVPRESSEVIWFFSALYAFMLAACLGILAWSIFPWDWHAPGNDPENLRDVYGQSQANLILGEALTYQGRIAKNRAAVEEKGRAIQRVIFALAVGPLLLVVVAWVLSRLF